MRAHDNRITLMKGFSSDAHHALRKALELAEQTGERPLTPRLLSPTPNGSNKGGITRLRPGLDDGDIMKPVENRAYYRRNGHSPRQRLSGVALRPDEQPWKTRES